MHVDFTKALTHTVGPKALTIAFLSLTALGLPVVARAEPTGAAVVQGQATVTYQGPNTTITQGTDKAIINWQDFSVGLGEHTAFEVPHQFSATLNRVVGNNLSMIFGKLTSNGQLYLINPNGIVFANGAEVDVNSLFASTLDLTDQDFMNGVYTFSQQEGKFLGKILNQGTIRADEFGNVALIAPSVENQGLIAATKGTVVLGAGTKATVDFDGDGKLLFALAEDARLFDAKGNTLGVNHTGQIVNQGGTVYLAANTAKNVLDQAVKVSGLVKVARVDSKNGKIFIKGNLGSVTLAGILDAMDGGTIDVRGGNITMTSTAKAEVSADVLGDGGSIILFSDHYTKVEGQLLAMGGKQGGDGGFIETSSYGTLDINDAYVNTTAPYGGVGTWLLDPPDYLIDSTVASTITAGLANTNITIETAVTGIGTGNIIVGSSFTVPSGRTLTLGAFNSVVFNSGSAITNAGGTINLRADITGTTQDTGGQGTIIGNGSGNVIGSGTLNLYYRPYASNGSGALSYNQPTFFSAFTTGNTVNRWELISSTADGNQFATDVNASSNYTHNILLMRDITAWTTRVNGFIGNFEGNNKTISNMTYNSAGANAGLFKQSYGAVTFYNLNIDNIIFNGVGDYSAVLIGGVSSYDFTV